MAESTNARCEERVLAGDPWSLGRTCGRPAKENGKCGIHLRAERLREKRDRDYAESRERSKLNEQKALDRIAALRQAGVTGGNITPRYVSGRSFECTGGVILSPEAVDSILALLALVPKPGAVS